MKQKTIRLIYLFNIITLFTGCKEYIEYEKTQLKVFIYLFIGTFLLGLIGVLFRNHKK